MKAAVLVRLNEPLEIKKLSVPNLQMGQVLVRVKAAGICGAQIGEINGAKGPDKYLPHLLGHEGSGIVAQIGEGVTKASIGDHVVMHWRKGSGIEASPPVYLDSLMNKICAGPVATFAEYAVVSENRITPIQRGLPFGEASLLGCAVTTGLGIVFNEAKLENGQKIAIAGVGGVGLNVIQGAKIAGAGKIMAIDVSSSKLCTAADFGATECLRLDAFRKYTSNAYSNVDVFVDCTGSVEVIAMGMELVAPGGKMILVGQPRSQETLVLHNFRQHYCGKTMMDSQGGATNPDVDIPKYIRMYEAWELNLEGLITHRFPLSEINEAISVVTDGKANRCILEMG